MTDYYLTMLLKTAIISIKQRSCIESLNKTSVEIW